MRVLLIFTCLSLSLGAQGPSNITQTSDNKVLSQWQFLEKKMLAGVERVFRLVLPQLMWAGTSTGRFPVSKDCLQAGLRLVKDAKSFKLWPYLMMDSNGKPPGGHFMGMEQGILGNSDECLGISVPDSTEDKVAFTGKFCTVDIRPTLPRRPSVLVPNYAVMEPFKNFTVKTELLWILTHTVGYMYDIANIVGFCVPSTCSRDDLSSLFRLAETTSGSHFHIGKCQTKESFSFDSLQIAIICFLLFLVLVVTFATTFDVFFEDKSISEQSMTSKLIMSFSVHQNFKTLMSTRPQKDKTFSLFSGMRFVTMFWIILCHTPLALPGSFLRDPAMCKILFQRISLGVILNGFMSVDSFFFIAAVIFSYYLIKKVEKNGRRIFNIPIILVRRAYRLLPPVLLVVGLTLLLPLVTSGPMAEQYTNTTVKNCRAHWWKILIFVQNLVPYSETCHSHFWYVGADYQFFIVAMIYFFLYFRFPKMAQIANYFLIVGCSTTVGYIIYVNRWPPNVFLSYPNHQASMEYFKYTHFLPYAHFPVFGIGLALGTFMATHPNIQLKNNWLLALGWLLAVPMGIFPVTYSVVWFRGHIPGLIESSAFVPATRIFWSLFLSWLTFVCAKGRGGVLTQLLSWKGFKPLNRPAYMIYLVHLPLMEVFTFSLRGLIDMTQPAMVWFALGYLLLSYVVGTILTLIFEIPLNRVEEIVFNAILFGNTTEKEVKEVQKDNTIEKSEAV